MPEPSEIPQPWHGFFSELDLALTEPVCFHCIGGFVISMCYGLERPTVDVDVIWIMPNVERTMLQQMGGEGSLLDKKYGVHLQFVTVAPLCENYEDRLVEIFPGTYPNIRLFALDPYDLALSKIDRNIERDRSDVRYLMQTIPLDRNILRDRYNTELRPGLVGNVERADATLNLWLAEDF